MVAQSVINVYSPESPDACGAMTRFWHRPGPSRRIRVIYGSAREFAVRAAPAARRGVPCHHGLDSRILLIPGADRVSTAPTGALRAPGPAP